MRASVLLFAMGVSAAVQSNSSVEVSGGCGIIQQISDGQIQNPVNPAPCSYAAPPPSSSAVPPPPPPPATTSAVSTPAVVPPPVVVPPPAPQNSTITTSKQNTITKSVIASTPASTPVAPPATTPATSPATVASPSRSAPAVQTANAAGNIAVSGASMGLLAVLAVLLG